MSVSPVINERFCDIILAPIVTEKSQAALAQNKASFRVARSAEKGEIKSAVEALFNVKVSAVNVLNRDGKIRIFRGRKGQRAASKIAIVTLSEGHSIDISSVRV